MLRIASITRSRSFGRTVAVSLITCDTVPIETPACSAICRIVTGAVITCRPSAADEVPRCKELPTRSLRVNHATESNSPGAVHAGRHQQELAVLVQLVSLREIPDRALGLIVTAAAENAAPGVLVNKFLGPLPHISYHIHDAERAGALRMCVNRIRTSHGARFIGHGRRAAVPLVTPRIEAAVRALGCVLPLPLMRQAFSSPTRVCPCVFLRDPGHRFIFPSRGIGPILPIAEKIQVVFGMIVGRVQKLLEFSVCNRVLIDIKRSDVHGVLMKASRGILPRILDIDADIVESLNLDSRNLEKKI